MKIVNGMIMNSPLEPKDCLSWKPLDSCLSPATVYNVHTHSYTHTTWEMTSSNNSAVTITIMVETKKETQQNKSDKK